MRETGHRIENYTQERMDVEVEYYNGSTFKVTPKAVISNVKTFKVIYDASSAWKPQPESESVDETYEMTSKEHPNDIVLKVQDPYTKENLGTVVFGNLVTMSEATEAIKKMVYDKSKHEAMDAPAPKTINVALPFGAPNEDYTPPEQQYRFTKAELDDLLEKTRQEAVDAVNRMNEEEGTDIGGGVHVVALDDDTDIADVIAQIRGSGEQPTRASTPPPSVELPVTASSADTYVPFSGSGMKLGEDDATEAEKADVKKPDEEVVANEDIGVEIAEDRWENDTMLLCLNDATEVFKYPTHIKVEGVLVYRYFASDQSIFGDLFGALCGVGVMVGSPIDKSKNFVLKYGTSLAFPHENICNWGGRDSPTYHIIARFQGGGVQNHFLKNKNKGSPRASSSQPSVKDVLVKQMEEQIGHINGDLSETTFLSDRLCDLADDAGEKMKKLYEMVRNDEPKRALQALLGEVKVEDFPSFTCFASTHVQDRKDQVKEAFLKAFLPKLSDAYDSLDTVKNSCDSVIELVVLKALAKDSGDISWKALESMVTNEDEIRARVNQLKELKLG